jgi:hypothetical protein
MRTDCLLCWAASFAGHRLFRAWRTRGIVGQKREREGEVKKSRRRPEPAAHSAPLPQQVNTVQGLLSQNSLETLATASGYSMGNIILLTSVPGISQTRFYGQRTTQCMQGYARCFSLLSFVFLASPLCCRRVSTTGCGFLCLPVLTLLVCCFPAVRVTHALCLWFSLSLLLAARASAGDCWTCRPPTLFDSCFAAACC